MRNLFAEIVEQMRNSQVGCWDLAKSNYENLQAVKTKTLQTGTCLFVAQFNPKRIVSSAAKVDQKSIQERKCFLCQENLPPQQKGSDFIGKYHVLVNPFPIFPKHLTVPAYIHQPQQIAGKFLDMLLLAQNLDEYVVFYNGPKCGASAPDHFHFQAGNKGFLPIERNFDALKKEKIIANRTITVSQSKEYPCRVLILESKSTASLSQHFKEILDALEIKDGDYEPMINLLAWYNNEGFKVCLFPREKHRPSCYFAEGEENRLISPASVDLGGVFILPRETDYKKITPEDVSKILNEVSIDSAAMEKLVARLKKNAHE